MHAAIKALSKELPVLIAGPTASGKSALALRIASAHGGIIVNADAMQVFANWRILTARPGASEEKAAKHRLYGHVPRSADYSVGHWLRDLEPILANNSRLIIVGGTGLYFAALTEGLASIPATPAKIRAAAEDRVLNDGVQSLLAELDPATRARIDRLNPKRVQRAWEVQAATGRGLAAWQDETPAPALPLGSAQPLLLETDRDWLNAKIGQRFEQMIADGAMDEVRANLDGWDPALASSKAIGAAELIDCLLGNRGLKDAVAAAKTATRQYAKRQRTWFRSKMKAWTAIPAA